MVQSVRCVLAMEQFEGEQGGDGDTYQRPCRKSVLMVPCPQRGAEHRHGSSVRHSSRTLCAEPSKALLIMVKDLMLQNLASRNYRVLQSC